MAECGALIGFVIAQKESGALSQIVGAVRVWTLSAKKKGRARRPFLGVATQVDQPRQLAGRYCASTVVPAEVEQLQATPPALVTGENQRYLDEILLLAAA